MSAFDLDALVNKPLANLSTQVTTVDDGEYTAVIGTAPNGVKEWFYTIDIGKGARAGQTALKLKVPLIIQEQSQRDKLGRDPIVYLDMFVDLDGSDISTKEGENVTLGRLFKALGINEVGASVGQLPGKGPIKIKVEVRVDPKNPDQKYVDVKRMAAI